LDDSNRALPERDLHEELGVEVERDLALALAAKPDVCFVTNPTSAHLPVALAAARAGCHLYLEKPVAHEWAGVAELAREVRERGLVAFVGYQLRFHPGFQRLLTLQQTGELGRWLAVRAAVGDYLPDYHPYEDYRRSYASRRELGGGVVRTQIHELDLLAALLGRPRKVFASGGQLSSLEVSVEDVVSSVLEFTGADGRPVVASVHQDFVQRPRERRIEVLGTEGKVLWDIAAGNLVRHAASGERVEELDFTSYPRNRMFLDALASFLAAVEGEGSSRIPIEAGALSLEMALAILKSVADGAAVHLEAHD
jgi:predicted dehydrogenase